jgi:hypothetical protein
MRLHGQQSKSGGSDGQKLRAKSSDIASIGKAEAIRTAVDRAFGELIITIGCRILLKPNAFKEIAKRYYAGEHG